MATKIMRTKQVCDHLQDEPGVHGTRLTGAIIGKYQSLIIEVDTKESPHDGWVHIVGPNPRPINDDGTYLLYGKPAWVELAHLENVDADKSLVTLEVNWLNKTVTLI